MVKPKIVKKVKVPIKDTGIASTGIKVALQFCKNKNTTNITSASASRSVTITSLIEACTTDTVSNGIR